MNRDQTCETAYLKGLRRTLNQVAISNFQTIPSPGDWGCHDIVTPALAVNRLGSHRTEGRAAPSSLGRFFLGDYAKLHRFQVVGSIAGGTLTDKILTSR